MEPSLFADPMRVLGFDATDLQINRTGRITTRQKRRILSLFGLKFMGVIVGFVAAFSAGAFLIPRLGTIQSWTAGEWAALVFGVLFGLLLQPQLCKPTALTVAIMISFGAGLVASPPGGPGENKLNGLKHFPHQAIQQAPNFGHGQRDQGVGCGRPVFLEPSV